MALATTITHQEYLLNIGPKPRFFIKKPSKEYIFFIRIIVIRLTLTGEHGIMKYECLAL